MEHNALPAAQHLGMRPPWSCCSSPGVSVWGGNKSTSEDHVVETHRIKLKLRMYLEMLLMA